MDDREKLSEAGGGAAGKGPSGCSKAFKAASFAIMAVLIVALILSLVFLFVHRHEFTHFSSAEATCTVGGNSEYWYCAGCGKYFEDKDGKHEIKEEDALIAAAGHVWVAASCEAPRQCSVCGYSDGEALGHEFKTYISNGDASCASDGTETAVCTRCDATDTRIIKGSALGHDLVQSKEVKAPTCTHDGELEYVCADCGHTETAVIPATGVHDWDVINITVPENCMEIVKLEYVCADCGKSFDVTISLNGEHRYDFENGKVKVAAVCNKGGIIEYACLDCGMTVEVLTPASGVHRWDDGVLSVPADCEGEGEMLFTCLDCGAVKTKAVAATGVHDWDFENGAVTPATETSEGKIVYSCKDCEETLEITFPASEGHDYEKPVITAPGCTTAGSVVFTCTGCGDTISAAIPATGAHDWGNGIVTLPTCESEGKIVYTCTACGAQKTQDLPIAEHVWIEATCTAPKTCAVCGATEGDALSHDWSAWQSAGDTFHSRECSACNQIENEQHVFAEGTNSCSVCGYVKQQSSGGGTLIEALVEFNASNTYNQESYGNVNYKFDGNYNISVYGVSGVAGALSPNTSNSIIFSFYSEEVLSSDMQLTVSLSDWYDVFLSIQNDSGKIIEYHPVRFSLLIYNNDTNDFEIVDGMQNLTMAETNEALVNGALNSKFEAGSQIDYTFQLSWEWAYSIEEPDVFEIRDEEGNKYYFNDNSEKGYYLSVLDTAMGNVAAGVAPGTGVTYDTAGNKWTILTDPDTYSVEPYTFYIDAVLETIA